MKHLLEQGRRRTSRRALSVAVAGYSMPSARTDVLNGQHRAGSGATCGGCVRCWAQLHHGGRPSRADGMSC